MIIKYYLGMPVYPIETPPYVKHTEGWQWCEWMDKRIFKHWIPQLKDKPWG